MDVKILISCILLYLSLDHAASDYNHWDMLVLAVRWPVTACKLYTYERPRHHCAFPSNMDQWTIRSLFPMRLGSPTHPSRCNDSWAFVPDEIKPIEGYLKEHWTNIYKDKDTMKFYKIQWNVHGTCGVEVEQMNSQMKYFTTALDLKAKYNFFDTLKTSGIAPNDTKTYTATMISKSLNSHFGVKTFISCNFVNDKQYLDELYLCFDKKLKPIDCDGLPVVKGILTSCDPSRGIRYPRQAKGEVLFN